MNSPVGRELKPADVGKVIAHRRVTESALHYVADETAIGAGPSRVHPQPALPVTQQRVELSLGNAGFNRHVSEILVKFKNPVYSAEINEDGLIGGRNTGPVAPVLPLLTV